MTMPSAGRSVDTLGRLGAACPRRRARRSEQHHGQRSPRAGLHRCRSAGGLPLQAVEHQVEAELKLRAVVIPRSTLIGCSRCEPKRSPTATPQRPRSARSTTTRCRSTATPSALPRCWARTRALQQAFKWPAIGCRQATSAGHRDRARRGHGRAGLSLADRHSPLSASRQMEIGRVAPGSGSRGIAAPRLPQIPA
jgi:hypothetical protein